MRWWRGGRKIINQGGGHLPEPGTRGGNVGLGTSRTLRQCLMSNFFEWLDSYSINIPELDEDHKKLVKLANAMLLAVNEHQGKKFVGEILAELIDYLGTHYGVEESFMRKVAYPDYEEHKAKHAEMTETAYRFNDQYRAGELDVVIVCNFFLELVLDHLQSEVRKLGDFVAAKELEKETG